jgi:hypothetical protein
MAWAHLKFQRELHVLSVSEQKFSAAPSAQQETVNSQRLDSAIANPLKTRAVKSVQPRTKSLKYMTCCSTLRGANKFKHLAETQEKPVAAVSQSVSRRNRPSPD